MALNNSQQGSYQDRRLSPVLADDYVYVDERSLPDLLLALQHYSRNINFYNLDNQAVGDWQSLLLSDDAILIASFIPIDVDALKNHFRSERDKGVRHSTRVLQRHIENINHWLIYAKQFTSKQGQDLYLKLIRIIRHNLSNAAYEIEGFSQTYHVKNSSNEEFSVDLLESIWKQKDKESDDSSTIRKRYPRHRAQEQRLSEMFYACLNVFSYLKTESEKIFEQCLHSQSHHPATGLLLAFLETYQKSQQRSNKFSKRLLQYYYKTVLHNHVREQGEDEVFLHCQLAIGSDPVTIRKNTRLLAGKTEDLQDINYLVSNDATVTGAKVRAIKSLFLQRHLLIAPENMTQSVTRIKVSDVQKHLNEHADVSHNLFGYDDGCSGYAIGKDASLGLVLSSTSLRLQEGQRHVRVDFVLNNKHFIQLSSQCKFIYLIKMMVSCENDSEVIDYESLTEQIMIGFVSFLSDKENKKALGIVLTNVLQFADKSIWQGKLEKKLMSFIYQQALFVFAVNVKCIESFTQLYQQMLACYIFNELSISSEQRQQLVSRARYLLSEKHPKMMKRFTADLQQRAEVLLSRYFSNAFIFSLTAETGWYDVEHYALSHHQHCGFTIAFDLSRNEPSIINYDASFHGGKHRQGKPLMITRVNPQSKIFPYSYLSVFSIIYLKIHVDVKGYSQLVLKNDHGMIDRSKPFMPFGPLPEQGSSFIVGGHEYAQKNLSTLSLSIQWRNLPDIYGGFSNYFSTYYEKCSNNDFRVSISHSVNESWLPSKQEKQQTEPLFNSQADSKILLADKTLKINLGSSHISLDDNIDELEFADSLCPQNGFLRLRLSAGKYIFGHKVFPMLMGEVLAHNVKNKRQKALPAQPFTPEIEAISVDYSTQETITTHQLSDSNSKEWSSHVVPKTVLAPIYYLTPFGVENLDEQVGLQASGLFPQWRGEGNLYIGFEKAQQVDALSLFFQLKNDSTHKPSSKKNTQELQWSYYSDSGWQSLESSLILSDSSNQLMHSGIVTIRLPDNIARHRDIEPANSYWLCVSCSESLHTYSSIQSVCFDTILLHSESALTRLSSQDNVISDNWRLENELSGIKDFQQTQPAFTSLEPEAALQAQTRLYERLRHKRRAVTAWDYERLVLARFPQLHLVKCFTATSMKTLQPKPGHVLLIAVPKLDNRKEVDAQGVSLNSVVLQEITDYLKPLMPEYVTLEVANAVYEKIQVRCSVLFNVAQNQGHLLKRLNHDINHYLSPWVNDGQGIRFGWIIRQKEIESFIRDLPYIEDVSRFSLISILQTIELPQSYRLRNTEKPSKLQQNIHAAYEKKHDLQSTVPWSLVLPMTKHFIEVINERDMSNRDPISVGISNLEIGDTFIIKGNSSDAIA